MFNFNFNFFDIFRKRIQGLSCPECDRGVLIYQTGWVGNKMIEYKICALCKYVEIMTQGVTIENIKNIEKMRGEEILCVH